MKVLGLTLAAATVLAGCASKAPPPVAANVPITTATAQRHSFTTSDELSGSLVSSQNVTVGSNASGRLSSVPVRVGDRVAQGQTLATIDAAAYAASLAQANGARAAAIAAVSEARAALAQAQARAELAGATARRDAELYTSGDVSRQHYDETQSALLSARAGVAQAQAALAAASGAAAQSAAAVDVAAVPLGDTVIRAPFAGIVTQKLVDSGAVVSVGTPVVMMEDDRNLEAEVAVPEELTSELQPGRALRVRVDALGADLTGRVRAVLPSPTAQLHTGTLRVALAPRDGLLRGMFVRVMVPSRASGAVAVPWQAVVSRAGQSGVFVVDGGRVRFQPVDTGDSANGWIAVSGIAAGTRVAIGGIERLNDGTAVALR